VQSGLFSHLPSFSQKGSRSLGVERTLVTLVRTILVACTHPPHQLMKRHPGGGGAGCFSSTKCIRRP
jgi:hypothetical protein